MIESTNKHDGTWKYMSKLKLLDHILTTKTIKWNCLLRVYKKSQ